MPQRHTHKTDDTTAPLCGAILKADTDATIVAWDELDWNDTDACENCLRGIRAAKKAKSRKAAVADRNEEKREKTARTHVAIALRAAEALLAGDDRWDELVERLREAANELL
jgi:hypothetical protein